MLADASRLPISIDPTIDLEVNIKLEAATLGEALAELIAQVDGELRDVAAPELLKDVTAE